MPGYRAGGPIQSVAQLLKRLSERDVPVITRDRDLGSVAPYSNSSMEVVNLEKEWEVNYVSPGITGFPTVYKKLTEFKGGIVYINGMWTFELTLLPVVFLARTRRLIIAPRGMLNPSALLYKATLKRLILTLLKVFVPQERLCFHATSADEATHIRMLFPKAEVAVIPNLPASLEARPFVMNEQEKLKLICVGRLSPEKNQAFLIAILQQFQRKVELHLVGDLSNVNYVDHCKSIDTKGIVHYRNALPQQEVWELLKTMDIWVSPTEGENYGHALVEALQLGIPVIVSDNTPWTEAINRYHMGAVLPLQPNVWRDAVERIVSGDTDWLQGSLSEREKWRAELESELSAHIADYKTLFFQHEGS